MNKKLRSIIGWIVYIFILVGLVYGIPKGLVYVLKTDYPMATITSGSMWPALKQGDLVLIRGVEGKDEINIGDIIVYRNPKGFTIHRVIKMKEDTLITKGDANNVEDSPIEYGKIIGKAVTINDNPVRVPFIGKIGLLINKAKI